MTKVVNDNKAKTKQKPNQKSRSAENLRKNLMRRKSSKKQGD